MGKHCQPALFKSLFEIEYYMNHLVWKLLRRHLNVWQVGGFFFANLLGMCIVLLSMQFYADVLPVFTQGDSFMQPTYLVVGKKVTAAQTLKGASPSFSADEIADLEAQPFVESVGRFVPALFDVYASVGGDILGVGMGTDMFFEAIPDEYVDADLSRWQYKSGADSLPVIIPRNYLNLYNFGFAKTKGLPVLSDGLVGMVNLKFNLRGTYGQKTMNGKVVAFSNRLNTILVPKKFLEEANAELSPNREPLSSRLILNVKSPADERIAEYLEEHRYEAEGNATDAGRMTFFLRMIVGIVLGVGLLICILSFYVLLLSIFLLLQKHTEKIDNLLLIGYSPSGVALPFHLLSWGLNSFVLLLAMLAVVFLRGYYLPLIEQIYPQLEELTIFPSVLLGCVLYGFVNLLNYYAIRRKVSNIWYMHRH